MEFNFKDNHSKQLFQDVKDNHHTEEILIKEDSLLEIFEHQEPLVLSKVVVVEKIETVIKSNNLDNIDFNSIKSTLSRIESKQNVLLEILENVPLPTVKNVMFNNITDNEIDKFGKNLELFNLKLIVISNSKDRYILEIIALLDNISEYLLSNSFYIFRVDKSPVKQLLKKIDAIGIDSRINSNLIETENILKEIDSIASMNEFEQNYYFAEFMLKKGLLLNGIILLNEAISIYLIESIRKFSKDILKYSYIGEEDQNRLNAQVKDFFINLFPVQNSKQIEIPLFPHHKVIKDIDKTVIKKLQNINTTLSHRGDNGLFKKYSYIIIQVREIRNNLAHGNMDINFRNLTQNILEIMKDFKYLSIDKNILKGK